MEIVTGNLAFVRNAGNTLIYSTKFNSTSCEIVVSNERCILQSRIMNTLALVPITTYVISLFLIGIGEALKVNKLFISPTHSIVFCANMRYYLQNYIKRKQGKLEVIDKLFVALL